MVLGSEWEGLIYRKVTIVGFDEGADPRLDGHELLLIFLFSFKEGGVLSGEIKNTNPSSGLLESNRSISSPFLLIERKLSYCSSSSSRG
jgi:hypothetical protein